MGDVEASDSDNNEQIPMIDENIGKKSTKNRALLYWKRKGQTPEKNKVETMRTYQSSAVSIY